LAQPSHSDEAARLGIAQRLALAKAELERVSSPSYLASLEGTIGADPVHRGAAVRVMTARGSREATASPAYTN
jgi:hypothetical protein